MPTSNLTATSFANCPDCNAFSTFSRKSSLYAFIIFILPVIHILWKCYSSSGGTTTKEQAIKEAGFTKTQVHRFETLAANPELVEEAKAEARANDDIVSRSAVMNKIKEKKQAEKNSKRKADIERQAKEAQKMNYDREHEHAALIFYLEVRTSRPRQARTAQFEDLASVKDKSHGEKN